MFAKKRLCAFLSMVVLSCQIAFATAVSQTQIETVAQGFLSCNPMFTATQTSYTVQSITSLFERQGAARFWLVTLAPQGYILFNGEDTQFPIRAFSTTGNFDLSDISSTAYQLLEGLADLPLQEDTTAFAYWQKLLGNATSRNQLLQATTTSDMDGIRQAPLLKTEWGQGFYYNRLCPIRTDGKTDNDGRMVNGCVALAAAQVMAYHAWPPRGMHQKKHAWLAQTSDFERPALWSDLIYGNYQTAVPTWENIRAVAWLAMDMGTLVDMDYDNDASGSDNTLELNGLIPQYYSYIQDSGCYNGSDIEKMYAAVQASIEDQAPVLARFSGHAFVLDGTAKTMGQLYFHANFGWDGLSNGWYTPDSLNGNPLAGAVTHLIPDPTPVLTPVNGIQGSDVSLSWEVPTRYEGAYAAFRIFEGEQKNLSQTSLLNPELWDTGSLFSDGHWLSTEAGWKIKSVGGNALLLNPINFNEDATLEVTYEKNETTSLRVGLIQTDAFSSIYDDMYDDLKSQWTDLNVTTNTATATTITVPSEFQNQPVYVVLETMYTGTDWTGAPQATISQLTINNDIETFVWEKVLDTIPGTARTVTLSGRTPGAKQYLIEPRMIETNEWHSRGLGDNAMKLPVTVASQANLAPIITVDERQVISPFSGTLQLYLDVVDPDGTSDSLSWAVEGVGRPDLYPIENFGFKQIAGDWFLTFTANDATASQLQTTWVHLSATDDGGAKGDAYFILGAGFTADQIPTVYTTKDEAFAAANAFSPPRSILLVANNSQLTSFPTAIRNNLMDVTTQRILATNYVLWEVNIDDSEIQSEVAQYVKTYPLQLYQGEPFLALIDSTTDQRLGNPVKNLIGTTLRESLLDPTGTLTDALPNGDVPYPTFQRVTFDNETVTLRFPAHRSATYQLQAADSPQGPFKTVKTATSITGSSVLEIPLDSSDTTKFYKLIAE